MTPILVRAGCFCAIILLGHVLRRVNYFKKEDFAVLSKIVIRITLTCSIVNSFNGKHLDAAMLTMTLFGFGFGLSLATLAYFFSRKSSPGVRAFALLNTTGVNIGNFVLPFAQSFLGAEAVMAVSLFDVGNSFFCLGGAYGLALAVSRGEKHIDVRPIFSALSKSVPFITYILMTFLCAFGVSLPWPVAEFTGIVGNANAFLAMLMLGVGFHISPDREKIGLIVRILSIRFSLGIWLSLLSWFVLPLPFSLRQALAILFLGPIASAAPAFTEQMKGDHELSSAVNSLSIVISVLLIVVCLTQVAA
ncbi:MAG: AEC family transporter [Clostridia bacterium]|nr:AEC family transporter [Clostridia bacterium]